MTEHTKDATPVVHHETSRPQGAAAMSESVGSALLNEIERVSAKRERWKGYMADMGPHGAGMRISIAIMTQEIEEAKAAVQSDDPARAIRALESLRGYDDND